MAQTRATIELLTHILVENGVSKVTAETFRLGKFNHDDAVRPLWKLLFELVYYCEFGDIDSVSVQAYSKLSSQEMAVYVKRALQRRGFLSKEFAVLPNDMTDGSRELLLAFGWLVCKENIIQRFMKSCASPMDKMLPQGNLAVDVGSVEASGDGSTDVYTSLQQLLLLNNKLRLSLRSLSALDKERVSLEHRVHQATYRSGGVGAGGDRKHLTAMEVYMIQKPELLESNLSLLDADNQRLTHLLSWKQQEDQFWRWMGSVLDAKLQSQANIPTDTEDYAVVEAEHQARVTAAVSDSTHSLHQARTSLHQSIEKYQSVLAGLLQQWQTQHGNVTEQQLDQVLESLDQELSFQRGRLLLQDTNDYMEGHMVPRHHGVVEFTPAPHTRPQFIYQPRQSTRLRPDGNMRVGADPLRADDSSSSGVGDSTDVVDIEDEMRSLTDLVERMELDLAAKQTDLKKELESLSGKFQTSICIPPMNPKC